MIRTFLTHWYRMFRNLEIWERVRFWEWRYRILEEVVVRLEGMVMVGRVVWVLVVLDIWISFRLNMINIPHPLN